jgi:DnaK suppressor protein
MADEMAAKRLADARRSAEAELESLRLDWNVLLHDVSGEASDLERHTADPASDLEVSEEDRRRIEELELRLEAITRAEERIADGSYGQSVDSGEPIPIERLAAIPWAERTADEEAALGSAAGSDAAAGRPHEDDDVARRSRPG